MISRFNYIINILNLFLILLYFVLLNTDINKKIFEFSLITLVMLNFILKLINWHNFNLVVKKNINIFVNNIFYNDKFTKLKILILSIIIPAYMIVQKDELIIDEFIEKLSFCFVFIFSLIGFYLEFFIFERKSNK